MLLGGFNLLLSGFTLLFIIIDCIKCPCSHLKAKNKSESVYKKSVACSEVFIEVSDHIHLTLLLMLLMYYICET